MHPVQAPQDGHLVKHDVLRIDCQIKKQEAKKNRAESIKAQPPKQPPSAFRGNSRNANRKDREHQPQYQRIKNDHRKVICPADQARNFGASRGRGQFPNRHRGKDHHKNTAPPEGFVCYQVLHHINICRFSYLSSRAIAGK
mgnify:CR=1 FL=1